MGTVQPADWFWLAFGIGLCVLAIWGARRIEPHWSAKDGSAFTCRYQVIGRLSDAGSSWAEGRVEVDGRDLVIRPRGLLGRTKPAGTPLRVVGIADAPPRRKAVYLLDGDEAGVTAIRVPASSPANVRLASLVPRR